MTRSLVTRALRALALVALVTTAASCGGSGDSGDSRQRNAALPETVDFDVSWVPESNVFELTATVDKIVVRLFAAGGNQLSELATGIGPYTRFKFDEGQLDSYPEPVASMTMIPQFINDDGTVASETELTFDPAVGAVKSASLPVPEGYFSTGDTTPAPSDSTPAGEPADFVLHFPKGVVTVTQNVRIPDDLEEGETLELVALVAPNESNPDATLQMGVDYLPEDLSASLGQQFSSAETTSGAAGFRSFTLTGIKPSDAIAEHPETKVMRVTLMSDAKTTEPGFSGAVVTSVSLKRGDTELIANGNFDDGNQDWASSTTYWENCEDAQGYNPCVSDKPVNMAGGANPVTDSTPDTTPDTTPASVPDTTPAQEPSPEDDGPRTISLQQQECSADYAAETRTITLCQAFDQIVAAGFEADGNFADTVKGEGSTLVLPEKFIGANRVSLLRLAVASKPEGLDTPTFRGEGLVQIDDGSADVDGQIMISPDGTEAVNDIGNTNGMRVQITGAGKFDIDWGDETKFSFVTLNGVAYDYYENVTPPDTWDEGKPLLWRAYAIDGFGLPRLVANGAATYDTDYEVEYIDPFFELWNQSIELIESMMAGEGNPQANDACAGNLPYLITDPVTPSKSTRVTLVVDRDCEDPEGSLGLQVWGIDEYDNWEGGMPIFSRMVSTRWNTRLEATVYLASGEYVIIWGDVLRPTGQHAFRVTGKGSEVSCIYPSVNVDPESRTGRLESCITGNRRVRAYAYQQSKDGFDWGSETKLPFSNGTINFSELEFTGPFVVEIDIDDAPDGEMIVCITDCERMADPEVFVDTVTVDTAGFSGTGKVNSTVQCTSGEGNPMFDGVDYYRRTSPTSWSWAQWMRPGLTSLPFPGEYYATSFCFRDESVSRGATTFTVEGKMPNRPANDNFEDAVEITPDIGRVKFSTVSATSQAGETGPFSSGVQADEFRSVWFKRTIAEGETGVRFEIDEPNFWSVARVYRLTRDGRLGLLQEWWWSYFDDFMFAELEEFIGPAYYFETEAAVGTTFYVQVLGDWVFDAGEATLVVNGGDGATAEVPAGNQPFTEENNTQELTIEAPGGSDPSTDTTVPTTDSTVATTDSTTPGAGEPQTTLENRYQVGIEVAAKTEVATVLAPNEGPATVEARTDAAEVQIPVIDLYATVSGAGSEVNSSQPLVVRAPGQRPKVVRPTDRTVTLPVGAKVTDLSITGVDITGKAVSAPLQVKKSQPALVKVAGQDDNGGSSLPWLWIIIAALVVVAGGAFALRSRRTAAPTQE
ncbi:MAG: hypothetical protein ACO36A_02745 [Ilumatobacteraceae bacterium]